MRREKGPRNRGLKSKDRREEPMKHNPKGNLDKSDVMEAKEVQEGNGLNSVKCYRTNK